MVRGSGVGLNFLQNKWSGGGGGGVFYFGLCARDVLEIIYVCVREKVSKKMKLFQGSK